MGLTVAAHNLMLNSLGTAATHASLHTADPGETGTNEVSGGSYARQAITWNAASSANLDNNANPSWSVPGGTTVTHVGLWSASSGGTFYGSKALSVAETFGSDGTMTTTDADISLTVA